MAVLHVSWFCRVAGHQAKSCVTAVDAMAEMQHRNARGLAGETN
jgi:hypothetical protein